MGAGAAMGAGACGPYKKRSATVDQSVPPRLKPDDLDFAILTGGRLPALIERVECRGLLPSQLRKLVSFMRERCSDGVIQGWYDDFSGIPDINLSYINLYQVTFWVIKPLSAPHRCSYVEAVAVNVEAQLPKWFVSHWWGETVVDFLACVETHQRLRALPEETAYWVCAYANNQHCLGAEIQVDPRETSFFKAMSACDGVLLVLDREATPFTRVWCCYEEAVAVSTHRLGEDIDRTRILNSVAGRPLAELDMEPLKGHPEYARVNRQLRATLAVHGWLSAVLTERSMRSYCEALREDTDRQTLSLSFAGCGAFTDARLVEVAQSLPASLRELSLVLTACEGITDVGLAGLAQGIASCKDLTQLQLNFGSCHSITDEGVAHIARSLGPGLVLLKLRFQHCKRIGDSGLTLLAKSLPAKLECLLLNFNDGCEFSEDGLNSLAGSLSKGVFSDLQLNMNHSLRDSGLLLLARSIPVTVTKLTLRLQRCEHLGDLGVAGLGKLLPAKLSCLDLYFSGCKGVGDEGLTGLAASLPATLRHLRLDCSRCEKVTDAGFSAVGRGLPSALESLVLCFRFCNALTDESVKHVVQSLPGALGTFDIAFNGCAGLSPEVMAILGSAGRDPEGIKQLLQVQVAPRIEEEKPKEPSRSQDEAKRDELEPSKLDALAVVQDVVAKLLGLEPGDIDEQEDLMDKGFDSLSAIELSSALNSKFPTIKLNYNVLFDFPTARQLATHISEQLALVPQVDSLAVVQEVIAELLSLETGDIDVDEDLMSQGFDSLAAVEITSALRSKFISVELSNTLLFDYPTVRQLAVHISEQIALTPQAPSP
mmetsp:Transcript_134840/g.430639  ORF Transcript_134840/g.430639 Transcript_134840/m.430639 type:complete len:824 (+) Transcript_134840:133-2604(+)